MALRKDLIPLVEGYFEKGHRKDKVRRIGKWRMGEHVKMVKGLRGGGQLYERSDSELGLTMIDRTLADAVKIKKRTDMDPVLFYYIVAMAEEIFENYPDIILLEGGKGRASDPGRRAKLQPRHIIYMAICYANTNLSQDVIAHEAGVGQKTASRYIAIAKEIISKTAPTPRKYDEHLKTHRSLRRSKKDLPGRGRGECIEDGVLNRMQRPGQGKKADAQAYNGRKKAHMANTLFRFNLRGEAVSMTPTLNGTVNDVTMAKMYGLDLGIATANVRNPRPPPGDRFYRTHDSGFQGIEKVEKGAICERTVGYRTYKGLDEEGRAKNKKISRKRLPAEWFFGRCKRFKRLREAYPGTYSELNDDWNMIAGLVNLSLMAGDIRPGSGHPKKPVGKRKRRHRRNLLMDIREIKKKAPYDGNGKPNK